MFAATNPRIAALAPAAVYVKSTQVLSDEETAQFLGSYIDSSKEFLNMAANTALRSETAASVTSGISTGTSATAAAGGSTYVDALAAEMAQNEKIIAQLKRVERTLHNYSESATVIDSYQNITNDGDVDMNDYDNNDQYQQTNTTENGSSTLSKEERKRLKKERKKVERKEKLAKNEAAAAAEVE